MLEATRLRAAGDVNGAWAWLRAALQSSGHFGRRTAHDPRIYASELVRLITSTVLEWAADPRVEAPLIRRALTELDELDALIGPDSDYYKVANLLQMRSIEADARRPTNFVGPEVVAGLRLPPSVNPAYAAWKHEPERSRRVIRLLFANWLAQADKPPSRQGHAIFTKFPDPVLYETGPDDPPASRALPPDELARWYRSSMCAFFRYLGSDGEDYCRRSLDEEKAVRGRLKIGLASQLYRREHGAVPDSPRAGRPLPGRTA